MLLLALWVCEKAPWCGQLLGATWGRLAVPGLSLGLSTPEEARFAKQIFTYPQGGEGVQRLPEGPGLRRFAVSSALRHPAIAAAGDTALCGSARLPARGRGLVELDGRSRIAASRRGHILIFLFWRELK